MKTYKSYKRKTIQIFTAIIIIMIALTSFATIDTNGTISILLFSWALMCTFSFIAVSSFAYIDYKENPLDDCDTSDLILLMAMQLVPFLNVFSGAFIGWLMLIDE